MCGCVSKNVPAMVAGSLKKCQGDFFFPQKRSNPTSNTHPPPSSPPHCVPKWAEFSDRIRKPRRACKMLQESVKFWVSSFIRSGRQRTKKRTAARAGCSRWEPAWFGKKKKKRGEAEHCGGSGARRDVAHLKCRPWQHYRVAAVSPVGSADRDTSGRDRSHLTAEGLPLLKPAKGCFTDGHVRELIKNECALGESPRVPAESVEHTACSYRRFELLSSRVSIHAISESRNSHFGSRGGPRLFYCMVSTSQELF